jgi:glucokinase
MKATEKLQMGSSVGYCKSINEIDSVTAKVVAEAAADGDELALEVYKTSGQYLGKGLSILIDILNPELIVIGSIYERAGHLLSPPMMEVIKQESLSLSQRVCMILPAGLGEQIGDFASLSVAACISNQK